MNQDIFTTIFIQSNIFTIPKLCMLSKLTRSWITNYLWICKLNHDRLTLNPFNTYSCQYYHEARSGMVDFKTYSQEARIIINTAFIEGTDFIYIKLPIIDNVLYDLLPGKFRKKYYNVITLSINKFMMIFRQLHHKKIKGFDESLYKSNSNDITIKLSYSAMIHYLTIILYYNYYFDIVDSNNISYVKNKLNNDYHNKSFIRQGIFKALAFSIEHPSINY